MSINAQRDEEHLGLLSTEAKEAAKRLRAKRSLVTALVAAVLFMIVEAVGGYVANSIAVMSDAAHVATDVAALALSLYALHATQKPKSSKYTYGWHRIEMLGALISLVSIWFLTIIIVYESTKRLDYNSAEVDGRLMFILGVAGLVLNIVLAIILHCGNAKVMHTHSHGANSSCSGHSSPAPTHGHSHSHSHSHSHAPSKGGFTTAQPHENVNVKSAMVHAIGDCVQSTGVIVAGVIVWAGNVHETGSPEAKGTKYNLADPITSFLFALVTLWTTHGLFKQVGQVLLEGSHGTDYEGIKQGFEKVVGPGNVHDLHIWNLTLNKPALTVHLVSDDHRATLEAAKDVCTLYGVDHTTIQVDPVSLGDNRCKSGICS